jgi:hypothetical protein
VNIPPPATATSAVNITVVAASIMSSLTTATTVSVEAATTDAASHAAIPSTASNGFASVPTVVAAATDANVATPDAGQKRKASP